MENIFAGFICRRTIFQGEKLVIFFQINFNQKVINTASRPPARTKSTNYDYKWSIKGDLTMNKLKISFDCGFF